MKRLKLLCISAAMATTLFSSTVFAAGVSVPSSLDVDTVINMAIDNSYSIKKIDIGIKKAQNSYNDALRNASSYSAKIPYTQGDTKLSLIKARDFTQLEYKYSIFQYTNVKDVAKNQLKLGVYQVYLGLMNLKEGLDLEKQNFSNVQQQYEKAKLQLSLGQISPVDLKSSEAAYVAEQATLNKLQRQYDALIKQLNQLVGVDVSSEAEQLLSKDIITTTNGDATSMLASLVTPKTYSEYLKDALTNRVELRNDNENINVKKLEFDSVRSAFPYNYMAQYKMYKYPIDEAQNKLDTDKVDISIEINTLYNDLQNKIKKLEPEQKKYYSAKRTYDKASQSYNLGLISKIDFDKAQIGLKNEENTIKSIQRDIWLAQTKLSYASNLGADASSLTSQSGSN
ncbi:TolC family protein [Clostridium thailandense]|uniref:TolC family protein n=1 Tax=Clostridium thailandense TaxID=2794346 RepID=UPI00398967C2